MDILIQARSTSTRFPGKIYMELQPAPEGGKPCTVLDQCYSSCALLCRTHILGPTNDDKLRDYCTDRKYPYLTGPLNNVLTRYIESVDKLNCDYAVRITSDCPLISVAQLFYMMAQVNRYHLDFCTNLPTTDGFDIDILSYRGWHWLHRNATTDEDREHVTSYLRRPENLKAFIDAGHSYLNYVDPVSVMNLPKISVDTQEDFDFVKYLHNDLLIRSKTTLPGEGAHGYVAGKSGSSPS